MLKGFGIKGDYKTRMDINNLISHYGYAALVVGALAEGETVTLLGGVAAHQGLLRFWLVVASVALGGMIGDQVLYLLGRHFGGRLIKRFSRHQKKIQKAQRLIQNRPWLFVIGSRFMYGFRIIGPVLIGASRLPPKIFLPLNIVGALVWAVLFTTLGYLGGEVIGPWLHHLDQHIKHWAWLIIVAIAVIAVRLWFSYRDRKDAESDDKE
jgi:membrane protein DedA with SNARE-associated domain